MFELNNNPEDLDSNINYESEPTLGKRVGAANGRTYSAAESANKIYPPVEITLGQGALQKTITVGTKRSALAPMSGRVIAPSTHRANCYIEVKRLSDNRAKIKLPESWRQLSGKPICYEFIDEDGEVYNGRTENVVQRLSKDYPSYFNGNSNNSLLPLAQTWKSGKRLFVGVKYICSSVASSKQNETSFIVQGKTLVKDGMGKNQNRGEGDPSNIFGSPLHDGSGGEIPEHLIYTPSMDYETLTVIEDPGNHTPTHNVALEFDADTESFKLDMPEAWNKVENGVYRWKFTDRDVTETNTEDVALPQPKVKRLFGHSIKPLQRINQYLPDFNGNGSNAHLPLPRQVQSCDLTKHKVEVGLFACVAPTGPDRPVKALRLVEGFCIDTYGTIDPEKGYNLRTEGGKRRLKKLQPIPFPIYNPNI